MHPDAGIGGAGATGDKTQAHLPSELRPSLRHESRAAFVAAADEAKTRGVTKRIQNRQIALTGDAKTRAGAQSN